MPEEKAVLFPDFLSALNFLYKETKKENESLREALEAIATLKGLHLIKARRIASRALKSFATKQHIPSLKSRY